ncbi:MAG TPA: hypothetical protein VGF57_08695 [Roseiarcus sp.]
MSEHDNITTVAGRVTHVFAHRFVVKTEEGAVLADLGPNGAKAATLTEGDNVVLVGEMKPSELKVRRFKGSDGRTIEIEQDRNPHKPEARGHADPQVAMRALEMAELELVAGPLLKPKHFEALGRRADGALVEAHIKFDGGIRKTKPAELADAKWSEQRDGGRS